MTVMPDLVYPSVSRIPATEFVFNDHRAGVTHEVPTDPESVTAAFGIVTVCGATVPGADRFDDYNLCSECTGDNQGIEEKP